MVVGRRGNVNFTNPTDFVRVIYQNQTESDKKELDLLVPSCTVPSLLRVTMLHTAGRVGGELQLLVVGVRATLVEETWTWRCTSLLCPDHQSFLLRTEVEWVELPEVWADQNTSRWLIISISYSYFHNLSVRFWLRQAALSCEGDRCWRHLLHPLPGNLPPEQTAQVPQKSNLIPTAAGDRVGDPGAAHHSIGPLLFLAFNLICLKLKLENVHFSIFVCTSCDLFSRKYPLCIAPTDPGNVR